MDVIEVIKKALLTDWTSAHDRMEGERAHCFKEELMYCAEELDYLEIADPISAESHIEICSALDVKAEAFEDSDNLNQKAPESMELQQRVSIEQLVAMFDYFDKHPLLAKGVSPGMGSQLELDRLWADLARRLNSKGKARKTPHKWKKYWSTLKCRIKKKAAGLRAGAGGTLSQLERRVLANLGGELAVPAYESVSESKADDENGINCTSPAAKTDDDDDDFSWPSEEEATIKAGSPPRTESPKQPRRSFVRGRPVRTRNTSHMSSGFEPWLISLERRRVAAEEKMAAAMKTMADAALLNAQTLRLCAQAGIQLRTSNGHAREPSAE